MPSKLNIDTGKVDRIVKGIARRKMLLASEFAVTIAKVHAPVDTGRLRSSVTKVISPDFKSAKIGTNVEYAPYVEFGTGIYAENGKGRKTRWRTPVVKYKNKEFAFWTRGQKPQRFLRKILDFKKEIFEVYKNA